MRWFLVLVSLSASPSLAAAEKPLSFNRDIRPLLSDRCFSCHGPDSAARKADLRLDHRDNAVSAGVIVPSDVANSSLVERIFSDDAELVMPPPELNKPLTAEEKAILKRWIQEGAEYQPHWAFVPIPATVDVPADVSPATWVRNPIDVFVLHRLNNEGITPAPPASRELWLRRVTFDLTGLPPTIEELDTYLADSSAEADEKVFHRLFQSPAYGERMANDWLDVARFADTFGYQADRETHTWPWRDWVIRAFQQNLSYRDFVVWQTAGDMLPNATRDQKLATAFNRLHRQTNEGGSIEAEFRAEYVADRVRTNGTAFLGLTFECARCHDHKYDPITQRDYYSLSAMLNNIDEHGLYSHFTETAPTPTLFLYEGDQEQRHLAVLEQVRAAEAKVSEIRAATSETPLTATPQVEVPQPAFRETFDELKPSGDYRPVEGRRGLAIEFGGDDQFSCREAPVLRRAAPFTVSLWVKPGEYQPRQIVVHQSQAAEDSAFRGFSLVLDNGVVEVSLVHFWPGNAIKTRGGEPLPLNEWSHLAITYDGSSRADGLTIYVNGRPRSSEIVRDRLFRDFRHRAEWGDSNAEGVRLALGARFRDVGFRNGAVDDFEVHTVCLTPLEVAKNAEVDLPTDDAARLEHALARSNEAYQNATAELLKVRNEEDELVSAVRQIMTMQELPWRRPTHLLKRGAYDAPGDEVAPDVPASILPLPEDLPRNRLGYAQWLVHDRNPLTARVAVNRYWALFFGRGLVPNLEDFGSQGMPPSHPELLDWLARWFMDHDWDVQQLCWLIANSATYRQSSVPADRALYEIDPTNSLLARGPRHRLSAEQLRDNALAVSGLLVAKVGGPSVYPYQPEGLWEESGTGKKYQQSTGEGLYRRSLYTFWRRTSPPPSMLTFDAPTREYCLAARERTSSPLQALVLLNDPQFVEAARVLGTDLIRQHPEDFPASLTRLFRELTARTPNPQQLELLTAIYNEQYARFASDSAATEAFLKVGETPHPENVDRVRTAAMAQVVLALFSYDECVMKR